jgi:capsular exopolysaccharide synthesis family protein
MVTSSLGGEGKSTTSANLAVVLAQAGKRVILVSADLRRPRVHRFFGVANDVGMSNVLSEGLSVSQVAKEVGIPNLRVIVGGPVPSDPAALLGSDRLRDFIQGLREVADFVLLDCPPVLAVADASILAPHADGTIFVMDAQRSSRSALQHSRDQLENAGATMLGSVYNNLDPRKSSSYPYAYAYYQAYLEEDRSASGRGSRGPRSRRHGDRVPEGSEAPARTFAGIH